MKIGPLFENSVWPLCLSGFRRFSGRKWPTHPQKPLFDPKTKVGAPSKPNKPWPFSREMGDFWVTTPGPILSSVLACGWPPVRRY